MLIIPDISFYQDNNSTARKVDFAQMKAAGASGVIIRAGQNVWGDPDFADFWRAAREAGLWRGTYWFYDSRVPPEGQADLLRSVIGNDLPELGVWMDFEEGYGGGYGSLASMKRFSERVLFTFPNTVEIGVYTAPFWWRSRVGDTAYFAQFPLWIAHYGVITPDIPKPFNRWLFWQFTSSGDGLKYGVESKEIDLNYYNGTKEQLAAYFGIAQPGGTMTQYQNKNLVNVDTYSGYTDGVLSGKVGVIRPDEKFDATDLGSVLKISSGVQAGRYVKEYGMVVVSPPPPPPPPPAPVPDHVVEVFIDGVSVFRKELF